ncbi:2-C-methyl-D-erythritol 4-phosphate cytidylyltransferase [Babesia caballi]|uniref:2-C-methyl-D-erythritol 4-phosphate cytidylyltransferase n=1 Tax=Babesia caballi TaxID=5871 RepID=A0AAV4LUD8_BABCB|nr:2-C-methyl-D-erythritol 4-phosphate cytidylyltransferase [Babesia caballi]
MRAALGQGLTEDAAAAAHVENAQPPKRRFEMNLRSLLCVSEESICEATSGFGVSFSRFGGGSGVEEAVRLGNEGDTHVVVVVQDGHRAVNVPPSLAEGAKVPGRGEGPSRSPCLHAARQSGEGRSSTAEHPKKA